MSEHNFRVSLNANDVFSYIDFERRVINTAKVKNANQNAIYNTLQYELLQNYRFRKSTWDFKCLYDDAVSSFEDSLSGIGLNLSCGDVTENDIHFLDDFTMEVDIPLNFSSFFASDYHDRNKMLLNSLHLAIEKIEINQNIKMLKMRMVIVSIKEKLIDLKPRLFEN